MQYAYSLCKKAGASFQINDHGKENHSCMCRLMFMAQKMMQSHSLLLRLHKPLYKTPLWLWQTSIFRCELWEGKYPQARWTCSILPWTSEMAVLLLTSSLFPTPSTEKRRLPPFMSVAYWRYLSMYQCKRNILMPCYMGGRQTPKTSLQACSFTKTLSFPCPVNWDGVTSSIQK